jgi:hypothetical protein
VAQQLSPAQRALRRDLQYYKTRTAKNLLLACLLAAIGVLFLFFFSPSPDAPKTGWLYQNFGEQGRIFGPKVFGILALVLAAWQLMSVRRRMSVGVRALEVRSRKVLGLPAEDESPAQPQTATKRLLIILGSMLVILAVYWLLNWLARTL